MATLILGILGTGVALGNIPPRQVMADAGTKVVGLYYDGQKRVVTTEAATVGDLLKRAGITLDQGDYVEPDADTAIPQGFFNVNVYRGQQYRILDGAKVTLVKSAQNTPRLVAADAGITLYPDSKSSPPRAVDMLETAGHERIWLNSACDWGVSDPLAVPKTALEMRRRGYTDDFIDAVLFRNPHRFLSQCPKFKLA